MALHYIIVVLVILTIIAFQIYIYKNTRRKIDAFRSIFPESVFAYSIVSLDIPTDDENGNKEDGEDASEMICVSQIRVTTDNPVLQEVRTALNMYLRKNKGAASDFHLMKDVVERYCDAEKNEIDIQQPIPLYLGLMGTMVGIILGIGFIAVSGGLSGDALMDNITSLMICVAIAMAASLAGIFCTTLVSWASKNATSQVEANKNRFYSWLQTELLPVLSGNAVNALYLLQQNLASFNRTFKSNIEGLGMALSKVEDSSKEQVELISLIKDIDIKRVAQANVMVLKELKECTGEIAVFNQYLHSVSGYLTAVNELNGNINEHLTRTAAIENMGAFFEREINQVATREQYINEVVAKVDDTLRKTFEQLTESTKENIAELRNSSVAEFDSLVRHYGEQKEEFEKMMRAQREEFSARSAEMTDWMSEIHNLAEMKTIMTRMLELSQEQSGALGRLSEVVSSKTGATDDRTAAEAPGAIGSIVRFPASSVYMMAAMTIMLFFLLGISVFDRFIAGPKMEVATPLPASQIVDVPLHPKNQVIGENPDTAAIFSEQNENDLVR